MQKPLVHLNGTSGESLLSGYVHVRDRLSNAIEVLHDAAPNARDYYPLGDDAFSAARREHEDRTRRLMSVLEEIDGLMSVLEEIHELAEHVQDAMDARRR